MESGRLRYTYRRPDTNVEEFFFRGYDLFTMNGLSSDGLRGLSMAVAARETVGLAAATERYGGALFGRGARFSGAVKLPPGKVIKSPEARKALSNEIRQAGAGPQEWHGVPIFEDGMEWQSISMTNDDAQFLETRRFTVTEIARWFGIPPHMIMDTEKSTSWGTGIEAQSIQFVQYCLLPYLVLAEESIRALLITEPNIYARFNVEGLLRGDATARFNVYDIAIRNGIYSPNECRELEDRNPREGGDVWVTPTAPQQSRSSPPSPPPDRQEPEEQDEEAVALAGMVKEQDERGAALAALRESANALGVPEVKIREILHHARKKRTPKKENHDAV
jgi:HK97 family phage portal protein